MIADRLRRSVRGRVIDNAPLGPLTTFRVGGAADVLVEAEAISDIAAVGELAREGVAVAVVGRGSNMLVSDEGFRGIALKLGRAFRTHEEKPGGLELGGAVHLPTAARLTARLGLSGFEFAAEIPATFGGAVAMNAGAHDASMADVLVSALVVDLLTGEERHVRKDELAYEYRHSALRETDVVCAGELKLAKGDPDEIGRRISSYLEWRRIHQPPGRSAGSVFMNPRGTSAGRLIEDAGAKGMRIGGAEVSAVHANFIVASPDACASDVWQLVVRVREMVRDRTGIELQTEVRFLGTFR